MRFYKEGLKLFLDNEAFLFNIALIHFLREKYADCSDIYKQLHRKKPNSANFFMSLLLTLLMQDDFVKIVRYKDRNSMTRPRAMMSKSHMSINKIILYASAQLKSKNIQVATGFLFESDSEELSVEGL